MNEFNISETTKLDKIVLYDVKITAIGDVDFLKELDIVRNVECDAESGSTEYMKKKYITDNEVAFSYLHLKKEGKISDFKAGVTGFGTTYCVLQTSVQKKGIGNVEGNTINEYVEQLEEIKQYLWYEYEILIDFSDAKLKTVEINRTFKLKHNFVDYCRILTLIMSEMPKMKKISEIGSIDNHQIQNESFSAWNKKDCESKLKSYKKVIFYNKSKQSRIQMFGEYMRFEIKLAGAKNISDTLKINTFQDLTQEKVNDWFKNQVEILIIKPIDRWKKRQNRELKHICREEYATSGTWIINILRRMAAYEMENKKSIILDVQELFPTIDKMKLEKVSRIKRQLEQQAQKYEHTFANDEGEKLQEIIHHLTKDDHSYAEGVSYDKSSETIEK